MTILSIVILWKRPEHVCKRLEHVCKGGKTIEDSQWEGLGF
jgi:hypothetical protein